MPSFAPISMIGFFFAARAISMSVLTSAISAFLQTGSGAMRPIAKDRKWIVDRWNGIEELAVPRNSVDARSVKDPQAVPAENFVLLPEASSRLSSPLVMGMHKDARAPGSAVSKQPPNAPIATGPNPTGTTKAATDGGARR